MPSLPSLLLYVALCAPLLQFSHAAPVQACVVSYYTTTYLVPAATPPATANLPLSTATPPSLPTNGGSTELPAPTTALKFVTVGRGVQNYSCASAGAVPVAVGAIATLFDFTSLAYASELKLNTVPPKVVYTPTYLASGTVLSVDGVGTYPIIGHHYFEADGTPTFDLFAVGNILFGKKIASINAPPGADVGPDQTGAVPWLMLSDSGSSLGLQQVYRVVTAGGKAPATCVDTNLISVQYAAEYWFYG